MLFELIFSQTSIIHVTYKILYFSTKLFINSLSDLLAPSTYDFNAPKIINALLINEYRMLLLINEYIMLFYPPFFFTLPTEQTIVHDAIVPIISVGDPNRPATDTSIAASDPSATAADALAATTVVATAARYLIS